MSAAIDHDLMRRLETAAGINPTEYGIHLGQIMHKRMLLCRMIIGRKFTDDFTHKYAIEQFEEYNELIKKIIGL